MNGSDFLSAHLRDLLLISLQLLSYIWNEQKYLNCRLSYSRYGKYIFFLFCQSLSLHKREEEENKCLAIFRCQWRMPLYNLYKMLIFQHPYNYWYDTKAIYRVSRKGTFFFFFYWLSIMWQILYMLRLKPNQTHLRYIFTRLVFIFFCKCKGYYQYIGVAQILLNNPNISLDYNLNIKWAHVQFCTFVSITLICSFSFIGQWYAISGLLPH